MSIYQCPDHGRTGPMACCVKASREWSTHHGAPFVPQNISMTTPEEAVREAEVVKVPARTMTEDERRNTVSWLAQMQDTHTRACLDIRRDDSDRARHAEQANYYATALACVIAVCGGPIAVKSPGWIAETIRVYQLDRDALLTAERARLAARVETMESSCGSRDDAGRPCCIEVDAVLALLREGA